MTNKKRVAIMSLALLVVFNCVIYGYGYSAKKTNEELIVRTEFSKIVSIDEYYNKFYNYGDGYSLKYPKEYTIDQSLGEVKISLTNGDTIIEIYYDNFARRDENDLIYRNYSNKYLVDNEYVDIKIDGYFYLKGNKVHILRWERKPLDRVEDDKNYYIYAEIIKNNKEIYTIFIKTKEKDFPYLEIVENFELIPINAPIKNSRIFKSKSMRFNEETLTFYNEYLVNNDDLKWGIFEHTAPENMDYVNYLESRLGHKFDYLLKYQHLNSKLDLEALKNASRQNKYLELTLQTTVHGKFNPNINYEILDGKYDDFLYEYAEYVKSFGDPVLFRLNNEMNGDWCQYNALYTGRDTEIYKALWRYIYNIFQEKGVDNAIWVWNPNNRDFPNFKWNHYLNYYPGDEYVDVIGLTAYNTGNYYPGEYFEEFDALYEPLYNKYMEVFDFPFIITEFAANSVGGDKVKWIEDMFLNIGKYKNIKAAIWFNGVDLDSDGNPARIYRLDENELVLNKFKEMFRKIKGNE